MAVATDLAHGVKNWWLGDVDAHSPDQELTQQFATGLAPDAADLIRFEDGQTEVDQEFKNIYATNRAEDPLVESYFNARDAFEAHEGMWSKLKTRLPYYIPIVSWLPRYNFKGDLISDLVAGVGVSAMLIPQALAYALLAGVDPQYGLYTSFVRLLPLLPRLGILVPVFYHVRKPIPYQCSWVQSNDEVPIENPQMIPVFWKSVWNDSIIIPTKHILFFPHFRACASPFCCF